MDWHWFIYLVAQVPGQRLNSKRQH
jgi:hypothetical protein